MVFARSLIVSSLSLLFVACGMQNDLSTLNDQTKNARSNDVASRYVLEDNGNFFRFVGNQKCQITNNVDSFKVSSHPNDAAMVYFERDNDLYVLHNASRTGNCPKASKKVITSNVAKYNVVSSTQTTIVNLALSKSGTFTAWDNTTPVVSKTGVKSYSMSQCYGVSGKSFSTYVAFAINSAGHIFKVKGKSPGSSNWDTSARYNSVDEFVRKNNVCK